MPLLLPYALQLESRHCLRGEGPAQGQVMVKDEVRSRVRFGQLNLCQPIENIGPFDVIFLRNVLIYFDNDAKVQIVRRVLGRLKPGGVLYIGHAESMSSLRLPLPEAGGPGSRSAFGPDGIIADSRRGERFLSSQTLLDSDLGKRILMNFDEVSANTLQHLIDASAAIRARVLRTYDEPHWRGATPDDVTESARRHKGQAESQRIARKDPLHLGGRRAQRRPDRRNPDSEHRRIEKSGEARGYADDDLPADGRIELGGFGRRCDRVGQDPLLRSFRRGPTRERRSQPQVLSQRRRGVLGAVRPTLLQFRDQPVHDLG